MFGGSGLLSHTVKNVYPDSKVVYNDFDNFKQRLDAITQTNILLTSLKNLVCNLEKGEKLPKLVCSEILQVVLHHEQKYGYVDYLTLSSSLLFSAQYVKDFTSLKKHTMYNNVRKAVIPTAKDYLKGITIVSGDYKEVYKKYKNQQNVVFLLDPPYLSTDTKTYNNSYWKLKDYLEILTLLESNKYFYFTSNKSNIVELMQWYETTILKGNPFKFGTTTTRNNSVNYNSKYEDIMIYKK